MCSLKTAYNKLVLLVDDGSSCAYFLEKKRANGITTEPINGSTKLPKLASVFTDQRSESVDLLRFPPLNHKCFIAVMGAAALTDTRLHSVENEEECLMM